MLPVILLCAVTFGVSLLTLFSGFGLGTLLLPAFALFLPAEVAVASTAVVHLANNLFKAGMLAGSARRDVILRFGLPAVGSAFLGALVLGALSGGAPLRTWSFMGRTATVTPVKLVLGLLILVFALFELVPALRGLRAPVRWLPLGGALSGFFGGLSGHQGALRAAFLTPLKMEPAGFAATQAVIALMVDVARLLVYGAGLALLSGGSGEVPWGLVAAATLSAFAGAFLGRRLLKKVTLDLLHLIVGWLLVLAGLVLASGL
jgi:uncharacterized membrane protein YfcA